VLVVHFGAALHVWSRGEHTGAAAPQSAFVRHAAQRPARQTGSARGQSESVPHSTQPSVKSQMGLWFAHWFAPLIPQSALPPPGPGLPPSGLLTVPSGDPSPPAPSVWPEPLEPSPVPVPGPPSPPVPESVPPPVDVSPFPPHAPESATAPMHSPMIAMTLMVSLPETR
jgi:hypothetical protein